MIFSPSFFQWHSTPSGSPRHYLTAHTHRSFYSMSQVRAVHASLWDHTKRSSSSEAHSNACLYLPQTPAPPDPRSSRSAAAPEQSHYCSYWEPRLAQHLSDERKTFSESRRPVRRKETTKSIINNSQQSHIASSVWPGPFAQNQQRLSFCANDPETNRGEDICTFSFIFSKVPPWDITIFECVSNTTPVTSGRRKGEETFLQIPRVQFKRSSTSTVREAWQLKLSPKNM